MRLLFLYVLKRYHKFKTRLGLIIIEFRPCLVLEIVFSMFLRRNKQILRGIEVLYKRSEVLLKCKREANLISLRVTSANFDFVCFSTDWP